MKSWDEVRILDDQAGWAEVDENGWGTLLAWVAGPENARRCPTSDDGRTVRVVIERPGVPDQRTVEPFTAYDRDLVEDGINPYLEQAGVPPRPRGYIWFIRVWPPDHTAEEFLQRVNESVLTAPPEVVLPVQWREQMESVLAEVYEGRP